MSDPRVIVSTRPVFAEGDCVILDVVGHCIYRGGHYVHLSPLQFDVAAAIIVRRGAPASLSDIFDLCYGDDPDGGPEAMVAAVSVRLVHVRRKLGCLGIVIANHWGRGWAADYVPLPSLAEAA